MPTQKQFVLIGIITLVVIVLLFFGRSLIGQLSGTDGNITKNETKPVVCTGEYTPVCGIDEKTYSNSCIAKQAKVEIAYAGACKKKPELKCTDTDLGKDTSVSGIVTAGETTALDTCKNITTVKESYCSGSFVSVDLVDCPVNSACADGKCTVIEPRPSPVPPIQIPEMVSGCNDSDDGDNPPISGTVSLGNSSINTDYCIDARNLKEFYCDANNTVQSRELPCPSPCINGACNALSAASPPTCNDTDSGNHPFTAGIVSVNDNRTYADVCDGEFLTEYYCVFSSIPYATSNREICSNLGPYRCSGNACTPVSYSCSDTDGGDNIALAGTSTTYADGAAIKISADFCADARTLREFSCISDIYGTIKSIDHVCVGRCIDNVCTPVLR